MRSEIVFTKTKQGVPVTGIGLGSENTFQYYHQILVLSCKEQATYQEVSHEIMLSYQFEN